MSSAARNCWRRTCRRQAEIEFRDAISADYSNDAAHAQLAMLLEKKGDVSNARAEAQTSVRLKPNVDALLVLARLDLKQNQLQTAASEVDRALALEPGNATALALKRDIAARQTVQNRNLADESCRKEASVALPRRPYVSLRILLLPVAAGSQQRASPTPSSRFASTTPSSRSARSTSSAPSSTRARPTPTRF